MIYSENIIQHCSLLAESYSLLTGNRLIDNAITGEALAKALYEAPFVLVSHGIEADPIFNFANKKAQELWEMDWNEFTSTPSRLSAEPMEQLARQQFLQDTQKKGFSANYSGIRISKTGQRFQILNTVLWNLKDSNGDYKGQAAVFSEWKFI